MEALVLDGKRYVKASRAARLAGYTSDYVGQLCRSGKIKAKLVGRSWYVDEEELREYKSETKRTSRRKAREQVQEAARHIAISDGRSLPHRSSNFERRAQERRISYTEDSSELIPELKKIAVESEPTKRVNASSQLDTEPAYEIENEGQEVVMSGEIEVEDAGDDIRDPDTVLLEPKIVSEKERPLSKKTPEGAKIKQREPTSEHQMEGVHAMDAAGTTSPSKGSMKRIELRVVSADEDVPVLRRRYDGHISILLVVISIIVGVAFIFLNSVWTFVQSNEDEGVIDIDSRYGIESLGKVSRKFFK